MTAMENSWAVIVPVKRLDLAKTRLALPPGHRVELALAMALDTVAACVDAPSVSVVVAVSDDRRAGAALSAAGAHLIADEPDAGLNPAVRHGAAVASELRPGARLATVASDLPAMRARDLTAVLTAAAEHRTAVVADAAGAGTTLFLARELDAFEPAFGADSWLRHLDAGAADLTVVAADTLRRDVDTVADLRRAVAMGCGAATTAYLAAHPGLLD